VISSGVSFGHHILAMPLQYRWFVHALGLSVFGCSLASTGKAQLVEYEGTRVVKHDGIWSYVNNKRGIKMDSQSQTYFFAEFSDSADVDPGPGAQWVYGADDVMIVKYDPSGGLIWAVVLEQGSANTLDVADLVVDEANGRIIIVGNYEDVVDIDPGPNTAMLPMSSGISTFIAAFDTAGHYLSSMSMGSTSGDAVRAYSVALTPDSMVLVGGHYYGDPDMDPLGTTTLPTGPAWTPFIAKYSLPFDLVWAQRITGCIGAVSDILTLPDGRYAISGIGRGTVDVDFDFGPGTSGTSMTPLTNSGFMALYGANDAFQWVRTWGRGGADMSNHRVVGDGANGFVVAGVFSIYGGTGSLDLDPGTSAHYVSPGTWGRQHGRHIVKLDASGNYEWAVMAPIEEVSSYVNTGEWTDWITITQGQVIIAGTVYDDENLPLLKFASGSTLAQNPTCIYGPDSHLARYVASLDQSTGALIWQTRDTVLCMDGASFAPQIASTSNGHVMLAGFFAGSINAAMSLGVDNLTAGAYNVFPQDDHLFFTRLQVNPITTGSAWPASWESSTDHGVVRDRVLRDSQGRIVKIQRNANDVLNSLAHELPTGLYTVQETWSDGYVRIMKVVVIE